MGKHTELIDGGLRSLVGTRKFYKKVLLVAVPIMIQNGITNFVSLLDNIMVGQVGTEQMSGVAIANQLVFIFNLCIFGAVAGAGILSAQFYGSGNAEGVRDTFRFKLLFGVILSAIFAVIFLTVGEPLIQQFIHQGEGIGDLEATRSYGKAYLEVIVIGILPFALTQCYSGTLRETGETVIPMIGGIIAVCVNLVFNYILIFGKLGLPALGGPGTGVATAIVYWVMFLTMVVYVCRHTYLRELMTWRVWEVPVWATLKKLAGIGFPGALAMLFEVTLFAAVALLIAPLGAIQVAGHQVALNFSSLLFMVPLSIGTAATIRTGFALGRKSVEAVRVASRSSWLLACMAACFTALVTILWRHQIAAVYNNDPVVLGLASHLLLFAATYQITDAVQVVSVGILRGYNDTRAILCVTLISYWVFALPVGYTLGRTHLWGDPLGPQGFWTAFIVGVSIAAVLLVIRVRVLERRLLSGFDRIRVMEG